MTSPLNPLLVEKDETKINSVGHLVLQVDSMGTGGINQKKKELGESVLGLTLRVYAGKLSPFTCGFTL